MSLVESTYQTIQKRKLIPKKTLVVVGVSGGADSLALLHVLTRLREKLDCSLHIATLDHGLRGAAGAADAQFVEETAHAWGLPVTRGYADVAEQAGGTGIEAAARAARYEFLAAVAHDVDTNRIAVAHHADDQAETVLMRLLRGAGTQGLRAMTWTAPVPEHSDLTLIRPFLDTTRAEIEAYCREHGLQPREDATNADTTLLRNRIRHEILPHLAQINPQISRTLRQMADVAAQDDDYLQRELERATEQFGSSGEGRLRIQRRAFRDLHPALQRRWVYTMAQRLGADELDYERVTAAVELAQRGQTGTAALLSGGLRLRVDYTEIVVERRDAPLDVPDMPLLPSGTEVVLRVPGVTPLPESDWQVEVSQSDDSGGERLDIPVDAVLRLRTRQPGDRFAPLGLHGHTQTIKAWMIDHKIPRALRSHIPLMLVNQQIAAVIAWPRLILSYRATDYNPDQLTIYVTFTNVKKHKP